MLLAIRHPHLLLFFFFNDTATTEIYTLSLHDALPISDQLQIAPLQDQASRLGGEAGGGKEQHGEAPRQWNTTSCFSGDLSAVESSAQQIGRASCRERV